MSAFQDEPSARGSVPTALRERALGPLPEAVSMTYVGPPAALSVGSVLRASGGPLHGRIVCVLRYELLASRMPGRGSDDEGGARQRLLVRPASAEESARVLAAERELLRARFRGS